MTVIESVFWILLTLLTLAALVASGLAIRLRRPMLALPALLPVLLGVILVASGSRLDAAQPVPLVPWFALAALGVIAGSPLSMAVLARTAPADERTGAHGGILVREEGVTGAVPREVMRGGSVIGYLERLAVVAAVAIGHPEVLAAIIAVKGLGRFSELDTSEARERFIIGTLVSLIWSTLCGALVWLSRA